MAEYFDVLKSIIDKKPITEQDISKNFVGFTAMKWLSADAMSCYKCNILNSVKGNKYIPNTAEYRYLKNTITLPKKTFLKFDKIDKYEPIIISTLVKHFNVGPASIVGYLKILGGEKILEILDKRAQWNNSYTTDPEILELRKTIKTKKAEILETYKGIK